MTDNRIIFPITPASALRTTQGDRICFQIPEKCMRLKGGKPCVQYRRNFENSNFKEYTTKSGKQHIGLCPHTLSKGLRARKRQIEKYNKYKEDILFYARKAGFNLPDYGVAIYFYFPMPMRWTLEDKLAMHGQMHHRKPDWDNTGKSIGDSLRADDERIAQLSGIGKFWVNQEIGYIEILTNQPVYNPFNVTFIEQSKIKSLNQPSRYLKRKAEGKTRAYKKTGKFKKRKTDELK